MTKFETSERLPHSARQMFDLVADVEKYCQFMPLCERSDIHERRTLEDGSEELVAALEVLHRKTGFGGRFDSLVRIDPDKLEITAVSNTGPVKHLENRWLFEDGQGEGCIAHFSIDYEMRSWPFQVLMNRLYQRAFEKISDAFRKRARDVYG